MVHNTAGIQPLKQKGSLYVKTLAINRLILLNLYSSVQMVGELQHNSSRRANHGYTQKSCKQRVGGKKRMRGDEIRPSRSLLNHHAHTIGDHAEDTECEAANNNEYSTSVSFSLHVRFYTHTPTQSTTKEHDGVGGGVHCTKFWEYRGGMSSAVEDGVKRWTVAMLGGCDYSSRVRKEFCMSSNS